MLFRLFLSLSLTVFASASVLAETRDEKVRRDREKIEAAGFWIYNDMPKAFAEAKRTGKPILVVLRCIPCEECVKLDDDLVNEDPIVRPLLDKFVCARVVSTNGLDLSLFQYDTDQSFAAFLLNADGTIYGRFGTRSHRTTWIGDVSVQGLAKALQGALDLHANYPANKSALTAKRGPAPDVASPELYPSLKGKYTATLNYKGNVVQSCIHCHQIGDAQRAMYRQKREPIPETVLFPYPHPKSIGLILNPKEMATIASIENGSLAEKAGFRSGDAIRTLNGQPLLSMADVQWVLHRTPPDGGKLTAEVLRNGLPQTVTLTLPAGWRRLDDFSWRASTWGMRRMGLGGMSLESLPAEERPASIPAGSMALRAKHVGQYGPHAAAKQAGVRAGDVLVSFDGKSDFTREADLIAYAVTARKPGEKVKVELLRDGKRFEVLLPMQE